MNHNTKKARPVEETGAGSSTREPASNHLALERSDVGRTFTTANQFQLPFTAREEELQKLIATERLRSEQRRKNYLQLKEEHLKLQNEYLNVQLELKQVLEEIKHLKDMKNHEVEELLKKIEDKNRYITRLEKNLKDHDPEILRLKFAEELEEPTRQLERERMRLENEKNKYQNDVKLLKLQIEHNQSEHLHLIQEQKSSYELEINQIKAERDEYKSRLAEVKLPPDIKRLLDLREENSLLNKRLDEANNTIETAKSEYLLIQNQITTLEQEHSLQLKIFQDQIGAIKDELNIKEKELRKSRNETLLERSKIDDFTSEIARLKANETKIKNNLNDFIRESQNEKDQLQKLFDDERENMKGDLNRLRNEIKNRFEQIQNKEITIQELQDKLIEKERQTLERIRAIQTEDNEKIFQLEQNKRSLEITNEELESVRVKNKEELNKYEAEQSRLHEKIVKLQHELQNVKSFIGSYERSVEELQHVRRQHRQLHEEMIGIKSENAQLFNQVRECEHQLNISREDVKLYKEKIQAFKFNEQEIKIENERQIVKQNRKHEQIINELEEKIKFLEKDNLKIKNECKVEHNKLHMLKAKQCSKIANKLNEFLAELKDPPNIVGNKRTAVKNSSMIVTESNKQIVQQNIIGELQNIYEKLRKLELYSQQLNSLSQNDSFKK